MYIIIIKQFNFYQLQHGKQKFNMQREIKICPLKGGITSLSTYIQLYLIRIKCKTSKYKDTEKL